VQGFPALIFIHFLSFSPPTTGFAGDLADVEHVGEKWRVTRRTAEDSAGMSGAVPV
jgi:hypothetical protein